MELAAHFRVYNWRQMLVEAPAGTLNEWRELQGRQPFTDYESMSLGATAIVNEVRRIVAGLGGDKKAEFLQPDALVPGREEAREDAELQQSLVVIDSMSVW